MRAVDVYERGDAIVRMLNLRRNRCTTVLYCKLMLISISFHRASRGPVFVFCAEKSGAQIDSNTWTCAAFG